MHTPDTSPVGTLLQSIWPFHTFGLSLPTVAIALLFLTGSYKLWKRSWRPLPPGPRGLPLVGNVLQLRNKRWLFSSDCREKHGDMIYMTALGKPILILNTQKIAADLLERRSSIYVDRPQFIVASEFITHGMALGLSPSGDLWRRLRKAAVDNFSKSAVRNYHAIQAAEATRLTSDVLSRPADIEKHIRRTTASVIMSVVYDLPPVESENDYNVARIKEYLERMIATTAIGAYWVEFFPWMKHVPARFAKWKRDAERYHQEANALFFSLFDKVKSDLANGIDRPSMSANLIKEQKHFGLTELETVWNAAEMFTAASETTTSALLWWCVAMVAYPQIQTRAHKELDIVVGRARLPSFADRPHLPYTHAMVKELLRWRPSFRLSIPHVTIADDWYEGMFVPKGTMCIPNLWQCNHQKEIYGQDADQFNPARFLDEKGQLVSGPSDAKEEGHTSYGHGKRACVGKHLANDSLFINIVTMLWAFRFEHEKDANGNEIPVDVDDFAGDGQGLVYHPVPYSYRVAPRFPEVAGMLAEASELQR